MPAQPLVLQLSCRRILALLLAVGVLLLVASAAWQSAKHVGWQPVSVSIDRVIDADNDVSIANW